MAFGLSRRYPPDGFVLTIGCDKTKPALLMGAATVDIPAISLSVGSMVNGWYKGKRTGSGTIVWEMREKLSAGEIDYNEFIEVVAYSAGYCNTMGTVLKHAVAYQRIARSKGLPRPQRVTRKRISVRQPCLQQP